MKNKFMVILLKELVILPSQEIKIELLTDISKKIINEACDKYDAKVLVVAPINQKESDPSVDDLPKIGVIASIKSKFVLPSGNLRVTLIGEKRIIVKSYYYTEESDEILNADTMVLKLPKFSQTEESAIKRKLKKSTKNYVNLNPNSSNSILSSIESERNLDVITDSIAKFLPFDVQKKLEYMQMINPIIRAQSLIEDIEEELEILRLENAIEEKLKSKMYEHEKDFFIKEKIKLLKEELGEKTSKELDVDKFNNLLDNLDIKETSRKKLKEEIKKYENTVYESPESSTIYNYLDIVLNLPWNEKSEEFLNSDIILSFLNSSHFGLEKIKERICDYADIKKLSPKTKNPIICLIGPPGVGKTSIASKISESLNRKFVKISVGGLNDSLELIGSRKTYMGSSYGKIIDGIKKSGVKNPVILIDEVDKMVKDYKGDPASVLLEILDSNENKNFTDNYIEEQFDLSEVLFILTANYEEDIPYILKNRLEIFKIDPYPFYEKEKIAIKYLLPNIYEEYSINKLNIKPEIIKYIIKNYTNEAGVRELDRLLHKLIRKIVIKELKTISISTVTKILGEKLYIEDKIYTHDEIGVTNALAYTSSGGALTQIEVIKSEGSGAFSITGNTGRIMDESIAVALSYIKNNYKTSIEKYDMHIHFLSGSSSKDGPSAGCAITTALLSSCLNEKIPSNIAFTGEISLNGKIIGIGSLKEKIIAAINNEIQTIYLPKSNSFESLEIPKEYLDTINIKYVENYKEIYEDLFTKENNNEN